MATNPVVRPQTAAVVTQLPVQSEKYPYIFLSADNLAGAEEVDIYYKSGETWVVVSDPATGSPVKLTVAIPVQILRGGALYGILKDLTAGACGVYWEAGSRQH